MPRIKCECGEFFERKEGEEWKQTCFKCYRRNKEGQEGEDGKTKSFATQLKELRVATHALQQRVKKLEDKLMPEKKDVPF